MSRLILLIPVGGIASYHRGRPLSATFHVLRSTLLHIRSKSYTFGKLVLQLGVANGLGGRTHLPQQLFQALDRSNDAPWWDRGRFAEQNRR